MEVVVTTGAVSYHQQTDTYFFYRPDDLLVAQPTVSIKALKGKISHSMDLFTKAHLGSSNFVSDH